VFFDSELTWKYGVVLRRGYVANLTNQSRISILRLGRYSELMNAPGSASHFQRLGSQDN
jgi:hypothetical protein